MNKPSTAARKGIVVTIACAVAAVPGLAVAADGIVPAPPSSAEAVVAKVGDVAAVGHTKADTTPTGSDATANVVELGGAPPSKELGGSQHGDGTSSGKLADTGEGQPVRVQVTPWEAKGGTNPSGCRAANGTAAVARVDVQGAASTNVLQSKSDAQHCGLQSTGQSSSDGATADAGDGQLKATVLHAEKATGANGHTYLLDLNGNEIGTDAQADGQCTFSVPNLLDLACLLVQGGTGTGLASVVQTALGGGALTADVVSAAASPANGNDAAGAAGAPGPGPGPGAAPAAPGTALDGGLADAGPTPSGAARGNLPRTGADPWRLLVLAVALLSLGGALLSAQRTSLHLRRP